MFDDSATAALIQLTRIKHLEMLIQIEKEGISVSDKIDAHMPMIISTEAAYYLDDYALSSLERLISLAKERNV